MRRNPLVIALAGVALIATGPALAGPREDRAAAGEAKLAKALEGRQAGDPVDCIPLNQVQSTTIIDGTAIIYRIGGRLYVNRPTNADTLRRDDVLVTNLTTSQLCSIDIVRTFDQGTHFPRGFVSLGKFVPYSRVTTATRD